MNIELYNGDCLEVMDELIDKGIIVDAIICDPPYGTTACKWDSIIPFDEMWLRLNKLIKPNGAIVLFGSQPFTSSLIMSNPNMFKVQWIWEKNASTAFQSAKYRPMQKHEEIIVFGKARVTYNPQKTTGHNPTNSAKSCKQAGIYHGEDTWEYTGGVTDRYPTTIQKFNIERGLHPTQKPVELMEYLVKTYTNENDLVLDFTMGSGTTMVACKNLNRRGIGIELDEAYFKIAEERIVI